MLFGVKARRVDDVSSRQLKVINGRTVVKESAGERSCGMRYTTNFEDLVVFLTVSHPSESIILLLPILLG